MMALLVFVLCVAALPRLSSGRLIPEEHEGFGECDVFFPGGRPPRGFPAAARICQRHRGEPHLATLYSPEHRAPIYSAFLYQEGAPAAQGGWMLEPQLDDPKNSLDEATEGLDQIEGLGTNQALEEDYASSDYQPGPLFHRAPAMLTNTVPMTASFRDKWASDVDQFIAEKVLPQCGAEGKLYLIAGAVPSSDKIKDKLSIPEYVWLAAACSSPEPWSLAVIKRTADVDGLEQVSLEDLESKLPGSVKLFPSQQEVAAEQGTSDSAAQSEDEAPSQPGAFSRFFQFLFCVVYEIVKNVLCLVWCLVKQVLNLVLGRLCWIWTAATTYLFALSKVLLNIPYDVLRVFGNILCGFVRILNNVFSVVCLILRLPTRFLCDMASFPYYTICAIPDVGIDILCGIWGVVALGLHAIFGAFGGSFSAASFAGSSVFSRFIGQSEGYEN
ncbi:endonuclease domain-containing 1 protein [Gastrophryne carolinensis]